MTAKKKQSIEMRIIIELSQDISTVLCAEKLITLDYFP